MRKNRSWLMGLGIGIVLGASMLQLILAAKDQQEKVPPTREQLQQEAEKAGYVVYPADEKLYTEAELQAKLDALAGSKAAAEATPSQDVASAAPGTEEEAPPADDAKPNADAAASASPGEPDAEPVKLYVRPAMTLEEAAQELEKLGVISDAKAFIEKARPIAKKMRVGNALFTPGMTVEDMMSELTRKKP